MENQQIPSHPSDNRMQNETVKVLNTIVKTSYTAQDNNNVCVTAEFTGTENDLT
jgi:hypothetical protein